MFGVVGSLLVFGLVDYMTCLCLEGSQC